MAYNNNGNGFAFISRNTSDNEKAPYFRGFIKITPELLEYLNEAETDVDGNVKLEMSLWRKDNGCSGTVTQPFVKGQKKDALKAKAKSTSKTVAQDEKSNDDF